MSLKKTSKRGHGTMNELNITPLLDLVFVLLVIFIITTPQLMNNLEMNLPSGKPPPANNKPEAEVHAHRRQRRTARSRSTTRRSPLPQLKEKLRQLKADNPDLGVVVKGADEVDYQVMVTVLDTLQPARHHQGRPGHGMRSGTSGRV